METKAFTTRELSYNEQRNINGGNVALMFIAGAIIGGVIYDVYKAACIGLVGVQMNHPEYYDGAVHSQR